MGISGLRQGLSALQSVPTGLFLSLSNGRPRVAEYSWPFQETVAARLQICRGLFGISPQYPLWPLTLGVSRVLRTLANLDFRPYCPDRFRHFSATSQVPQLCCELPMTREQKLFILSMPVALGHYWQSFLLFLKDCQLLALLPTDTSLLHCSSPS